MLGSGNRLVRLLAAVCVLAACSASDEEGTGRNPQTGNFGNAGTGSGAGTGGTSGFGNSGPGPTLPPGTSGIGGGGTGNPITMGCGMADVTAARVTPTVMLVVDGSTSMEMAYGSSTRWNAIRDALVGANGVVPALEGVVKFGLAVFGTMPTCPLPMGMIDPALNNLQAITGGIPGSPPGFTTPTGLALDMVVDRLPDPTVAVDEEIGPQIVVLATDGDPNDCLLPIPNTQPSIDAAMKLQAKHQQMYVISVGMDAAAAHLQEMANIGAGMPANSPTPATVYYPEDPAALAATLMSLIGQVVGCQVALQGSGVLQGSECMGEVKLNGAPLECNGPDGWRLIDPHRIELQGAACESFKTDALAMLHARFPCEILVE